MTEFNNKNVNSKDKCYNCGKLGYQRRDYIMLNQHIYKNVKYSKHKKYKLDKRTFNFNQEQNHTNIAIIKANDDNFEPESFKPKKQIWP